MGLLGAIGLDDIFGEIGKTVRQILPNKEAQREFDIKLAQMKDLANQRVHEQMLAQMEVNKAEAGHASLFVAGWRPAVGWVCAAALAYNFLLSPLLVAFIPEMKMLDIEGLIMLVLTMLGSSTIRTFEKTKGVSSDTLASPALANFKNAQVVEVQTDNTVINEAPSADAVPTTTEVAPWDRK